MIVLAGSRVTCVRKGGKSSGRSQPSSSWNRVSFSKRPLAFDKAPRLPLCLRGGGSAAGANAGPAGKASATPLPGPAARGPRSFAGHTVGLLWFSRLTPFIASVSRILAMSFLQPPYACRLFAMFLEELLPRYCHIVNFLEHRMFQDHIVNILTTSSRTSNVPVYKPG